MTTRSISRGGMGKKRVCVFLLLVAVGILCLCALMYMLFHAMPHSNPTIKDGGHSSAERDTPHFLCTFAEGHFVRS